VPRNETATCLRAGEVEEAWIGIKKGRISAVVEESWECVRAIEM